MYFTFVVLTIKLNQLGGSAVKHCDNSPSDIDWNPRKELKLKYILVSVAHKKKATFWGILKSWDVY